MSRVRQLQLYRIGKYFADVEEIEIDRARLICQMPRLAAKRFFNGTKRRKQFQRLAEIGKLNHRVQELPCVRFALDRQRFVNRGTQQRRTDGWKRHNPSARLRQGAQAIAEIGTECDSGAHQVFVRPSTSCML